MNAKVNSIIVDDEISGIESLQLVLNALCPEVTVLGTAQTMDEAKKLILNLDLDLVFLDVQIGTQTIFQLLNDLETIDFEIIFVSAHDHALKAIKFMAIDYLLKPINTELLKQAVDRAIFNKKNRNFYDHAKELLNSINKTSNHQPKIAVPTKDGYEFVATSEILYCSAQRSYTIIHLKDNSQIVASQNLKHYEDLLMNEQFVRIHNSHLINLPYIKNISRSDGGFVKMIDNQILPISKARKEKLLLELKLK